MAEAEGARLGFTLCAGLLEAKRQSDQIKVKPIVNIYRAGDRFEVGPFSIEAVPVSHSIPERLSLAITTPLGTVIHTGDWKLDPDPEIGLAPTRRASVRWAMPASWR